MRPLLHGAFKIGNQKLEGVQELLRSFKGGQVLQHLRDRVTVVFTDPLHFLKRNNL